jgi:hypothetical protein
VIRLWKELGARERIRVLTIAGAGYVAPWVTGVGVKLYLDALGQPTHAWGEFLSPSALAIIIPATAVWASPFLVLALVAAYLQRLPDPAWLTRADRWIVVYGGLVVGLWGEVRLFVEVFWDWSPVALFAGFLLAVYCVPFVLAGALGGTVVALAQRAVRRARDRGRRSDGNVTPPAPSVPSAG